MNNEDHTFRTNDMGLTAFFYYHGLRELKTKWDEDSICWWIFEESNSLSVLFEDWIGNTASVEPRKYNRAYMKVRKNFYQEKPGRV